jgi:hypothetical protein
MMENEKTDALCKKYGLEVDDMFNHKHYRIITRKGIDKIQAIEKIFINYEAVKVEPEFCVVKASAKKDNARIETFGSAKYGSKSWNPEKNNNKGGWDESGNTSTWYVMEVAEKRAMSRAVLKLTGFYELGVFGEDESEDFKRSPQPSTKPIENEKKKLAINADIAKNESGKKTPLATMMLKYSMTAEQQSKYVKLLDQ